MKIVTLMENTAVSEKFQSSHGLSFYIETKNHKILFDMGQDEKFLENAEELGIDIEDVDLAILSHGHYDHGGGLEAFLEVNKKAPVHIQKKALGEFYAQDPGKLRYIGLSDTWRNHPRIVCHTGDYKLDAGLMLFAGVTGRECYSPANDRLLVSMNGHLMQDLFMHEQNLLVKEGNKMVLIAGCAHNGIVNILNKAESLCPSGVDEVLGGMHLMHAYSEEEKQREFCHEMAEKLKEHRCRYHTGHCTSIEAFEMLKKELGDKINYLAAGSVLNL